MVDLKYSLEEKEKQLSQNQTIIFFSQTLSIDWAANGALEIISSTCWSSNNFDSIFFILRVVSVIFVIEAKASDPNWDDTFGAMKRRRLTLIAGGVESNDELFVWACTEENKSANGSS